jgi:hypothetical protein
MYMYETENHEPYCAAYVRTLARQFRLILKFLTRKEVEAAKQKEDGRKNPTGMSPRNRKASHSISTAVLQSIAKIRTLSTTKSSRKTYSPHIPFMLHYALM